MLPRFPVLLQPLLPIPIGRVGAITTILLVGLSSMVWAKPTIAIESLPPPTTIQLHGMGAGPLCIDSAGATDQQPVTTETCVAGKQSQLFGYNRESLYIHLEGTNARCNEGPPCCLEDFFGGPITLWGCSDPAGKQFHFNASSGWITNGGQCLTAAKAGSSVNSAACSPSNAGQVWSMPGVSPAPPTPPGPAPPPSNTCSSMGCNIPYEPNLPCQCNSDCCSYGNCCADFKSQCGGCTPR
jgi:hypothetical protein